MTGMTDIGLRIANREGAGSPAGTGELPGTSSDVTGENMPETPASAPEENAPETSTDAPEESTPETSEGEPKKSTPETSTDGSEETAPEEETGTQGDTAPEEDADAQKEKTPEITGEGTLQDPEGEAQIPALWVGGAALAVILCLGAAAVCFRQWKKRKAGEEVPEFHTERMPGQSGTDGGQPMQRKTAGIGKLHHIGMRKQQQDSLGITETADGLCAVVADGMGGLSQGDKVSQKIVMTMLQDASRLPRALGPGSLFEMVAHANEEVNRMLGVENQYKSGSTLISVLVRPEGFEWVSVGDSRIYLYRNEKLIQLNREHTYEAELLEQAVNGEISFAEAQKDPRKKGLTSFIGMGKLKYIDGSRRPVAAQAGDRLLLMSDGVFNTLSEQEMCEILKNSGSPEEAAQLFEQRILAYQRPKQDNFTAVILEL